MCPLKGLNTNPFCKSPPALDVKKFFKDLEHFYYITTLVTHYGLNTIPGAMNYKI